VAWNAKIVGLLNRSGTHSRRHSLARGCYCAQFFISPAATLCPVERL